jgi:hypothetical protein
MAAFLAGTFQPAMVHPPALTRLGAPHLLHFTSSRVLPCVMITFRIASLTKRSDSWRIASFDIAASFPSSEELGL